MPLAATLLLALVLVLLAGANPVDALHALLDGAFLSKAALGETLARSTAIVLTATGACLAFRGGILNIGLDGQLLAGAVAGAAVGPLLASLGGFGTPIVLVVAALAGAAFTLPAFFLSEGRRVPPVLTTILLNLLALALVAWIVRGPLRDPAGDYPQTRPLTAEQRLAPLVSGTRATVAVPIAFLLAGAVGFALVRTRPGLLLRAAGDSPGAARAAGLPDVAIRGAGFLLSGGLAGLAGGLEVAALTGRVYDPFAPGLGYTGIAAALLGGLRPVPSAFMGLLLAALGAGSSAMQRDAGVPASLAAIVPGIAVVAVLLSQRRKDG